MNIEDLLKDPSANEEFMKFLSEKTGISKEQLENTTELSIARALINIIEQSDIVLAYMGPDSYIDTLLAAMYHSIDKSSINEEQKSAKIKIAKETVTFAVREYYEKVIMNRVKAFIAQIEDQLSR